jgi:hypothetical protein
VLKEDTKCILHINLEEVTRMIINTINLVELVAEEGKKLVDKEMQNTYSKIMVMQDKVSDYKEISIEEAEAIEKAKLVEE